MFVTASESLSFNLLLTPRKLFRFSTRGLNEYQPNDDRLARTIEATWDTQESKRASKKGCEPLVEPDWPYYKRWFYYCFSLFPMIDAAAVLPSWVSFLGHTANKSTTFIRTARILRLLRLAKLSKHSKETLNLLKITLEQSVEALLIMVFLSLIAIVIVGSIVFIFEGSPLKPQPTASRSL